jgi:hypothetical protein
VHHSSGILLNPGPPKIPPRTHSTLSVFRNPRRCALALAPFAPGVKERRTADGLIRSYEWIVLTSLVCFKFYVCGDWMRRAIDLHYRKRQCRGEREKKKKRRQKRVKRPAHPDTSGSFITQSIAATSCTDVDTMSNRSSNVTGLRAWD